MNRYFGEAGEVYGKRFRTLGVIAGSWGKLLGEKADSPALS
jgi:hypothetical protein